jgi:tRNA dimethylallyltransferase
MLSYVEPLDDYNAALYQKDARKVIEDIYDRGKIPILCGGTGLYAKSILYDMDFSTAVNDDAYRKKLQDIYEDKGVDYLYDMLKEVDIESANSIHKNNVKRVMRALEIYHVSGVAKSDQKQEEKEYYDKTCIIGLYHDRQKLYDRINMRVDIMVKEGLEQEARNLYNKGCTLENNCMQAIGYKEYFQYFDGLISLDECIDKIKQSSRKYAKRQMTWFNKMDVKWFQFEETILQKHTNIYKYIINNCFIL